MKVKKYVAPDYSSAISQAKQEMGKDAIILSSRQIRRKGFLGMFAKPLYEVTVAMDNDLRVEMDRMRANSPAKSAPISPKSDPFREQALLEEIQNMKTIMDDIKKHMNEMNTMQGISDSVQHFYHLLLKHNVNEEVAMRIAAQVDQRLPQGKDPDPVWVRDVCIHTIQEYLGEIVPIRPGERGKCKTVVLVGPTGVGKTTTLAKLAANMTFLEARDVAFITLDTYRISAAEQLRTFAEIIGIPIRVVFQPLELEEAIEEYNDKDLIFIDTAGRSPYNEDHMEELAEFLQVAKADEVVLVLSVTSDSSDLLKTYERFNMIGVDKIIFTKLDETDSYGQVLNVLHEINKPVAYFTTGQNVPDDIEVPDPSQFARMFLEGEDA